MKKEKDIRLTLSINWWTVVTDWSMYTRGNFTCIQLPCDHHGGSGTEAVRLHMGRSPIAPQYNVPRSEGG